MTKIKPSPVTEWRKRRKREGFVRVELQVKKEDASLVRDVAKALLDPERESKTRSVLRNEIMSPRVGGLKALLDSAPLEGIDLERPRDFGRDTSF
ncbi:MAG: hypothetical protein OXG15_04745 [Gammaproteobacteria bacterium]|nr:hypothetical protein [Gammaproteobacteria bacterium]